MDERVVGLNGQPVDTPEVWSSAVQVLEEALERAKRGEIASFSIAEVDPAGFATYQSGGQISYSLIGAVSMLQFQLQHIQAETFE